MIRFLRNLRARHRVASQVALGLLLALGYNVLPTSSAPTPIVYSLRWYQPGTGQTDTPLAMAFNRAASQVAGGGVAVSAVAYPAPGTEAAPGALLNITAAGEDSSRLLFEVEVNGVLLSPGVLGSYPTPRGDNKFQTAKLSALLGVGIAEHSVRIKVTTTSGTPTSAFTPLITVVDPREELKREVSQLPTLTGGAGYTDLDAYVAEMAPIIERAQADFRIHGWGDAGERGYYSDGNVPVSYSSTGGTQPLFLDGRGSLRDPAGQPIVPAPDVSGALLRLEPWVTKFGGPLSAAEEASGEYFAGLLNAEGGKLGLSSYADLFNVPATVAPGPSLPLVYPVCFPRQNVEELVLPDQLFLETTLESLKAAPFALLGFIPQPTPTSRATKVMQDLADTGRLFNDQTANLHSPATGGAADVNHGARHAPHVPRVRVFQAIRDGVTVPVVKWTFSDAKCNHTQAAAEVRVNDGLIAAGALDGPFSRTLSPVGTAYSVQVKVFDNEGFSSSRTVLVQP